ncbi:putative serine/threonine-protein kinase-like [Dorcoceras hygrometricum]|uniref:non-specific serine/threonine protein kinase n=1 Tax=Dorcoceras hygrometricum TaxID=472368 RepID=A0A2Z7BQC9_9LAMI|nr:putative serine/threonine-protein kinase-like [Dorcoceras hygrometricum]
MAFNVSSIGHQLSKQISVFGMKLWVSIVIGVLVILILILVCVLVFRKKRRKNRTKSATPGLPINPSFMDKRLLSVKRWDIEANMVEPEKQVMYCDDKYRGVNGNSIVCNSSDVEDLKPVVLDYSGSMNHWTLREIEEATGGLIEENVIGTGDHGIVFRGLAIDNTQVVVKKLYNCRSRVNGFMKEAEAMLFFRHKNLARLMGYCAEGTYRMLVSEYVDNGNLRQWLHRPISEVSPLSWKIRVRIIIGLAKGLAYLHEDIEPAVIHQNLKSTNILVDKQWNPKISDYGITKLLGPEWNHVTVPPVGMTGYVAPEVTNMSLVSTKSDVYSFGVVVLEIVSGKASTFLASDEIEEQLVDWVKSMVSDQKYDVVSDPRLPELPPARELKRILLIALRCVDFEVENRPKMGEILHMLEPRDLLLSDVWLDVMDCAKATASVRKAKKKQVKGELDRLKQAEKKKRRLEKALATSAAIRSELEKKKQKKKEEQERLDEEGAAIAEAVALHVLLGEDSEDSGNIMHNRDEGLTSLDHARQIDVIFGKRHGLCPCFDQPSYSFESSGRASDARLYGQMQSQWGHSTWATDPQEKYFYSICYEEDDLSCTDLSADLVAAEAVSSLKNC